MTALEVIRHNSTRCILGILLVSSHCPAQTDLEGAAYAREFLSPATEQNIQQIITSALQGTGNREHLRGKKPRSFTEEGILLETLDRNLSIQVQKLSTEIAQYQTQVSRAVFDPVLNLGLTYSNIQTFNRIEEITRPRVTSDQLQLRAIDTNDPTTLPTLQNLAPLSTGQPAGTSSSNTGQPGTSTGPSTTGITGQPGGTTPATGQPNLLDPSNIPVFKTGDAQVVCINVDDTLVTRDSPCIVAPVPAPSSFPEQASFASGPFKSLEMRWGGSKVFSWGSSLSLDLRSTYVLDVFSAPGGGKFPWSSSFSSGFTTPLPFSRNFGFYGSFANVTVKLADISQRQADLALVATANAVLRDINGSYWELVRALLQLYITRAQRHVLEDLSARRAKQYNLRQLTNYDRAQLEADLANIANNEELAWNNVITNSNRIVELLNYDNAVIVVPTNYIGRLQQLVVVDEHQAFTTAMERRPETLISQLALESSEVLVQHRRIQTLPDLFLNASVELTQVGNGLGYNSWEDSMSNLFNPDFSNYTVGLSFRIPFGNRAVKAALGQARSSRTQALDNLFFTRNNVTQELNSIVTTTYTTQSQINQSQANLNLANLAYTKAVGLREQQLSSEFELLTKLSDLLNAKAAYINALVDHQKTRAQLEAAQGTLAEHYWGIKP